jgi:hypothetical protein
MRVNLIRRNKNMEKGFFDGVMVLITMDSMKMTKGMAKAGFSGRTAKHMKEAMCKIRELVMEPIAGLMVRYTRVLFLTERGMEKEFLRLRMVFATRENGFTTGNTGKENYTSMMEKLCRGLGLMEN